MSIVTQGYGGGDGALVTQGYGDDALFIGVTLKIDVALQQLEVTEFSISTATQAQNILVTSQIDIALALERAKSIGIDLALSDEKSITFGIDVLLVIGQDYNQDTLEWVVDIIRENLWTSIER